MHVSDCGACDFIHRVSPFAGVRGISHPGIGVASTASEAYFAICDEEFSVISVVDVVESERIEFAVPFKLASGVYEDVCAGFA